MLGAANAQRKVLELQPLTALAATTSLRDGLEAIGKEKGVQAVPKAQALADLARLRELLQRWAGPEERKSRADIIEELEALRQDPAVESSVARERFLQIALDQVESELCPVCGTPWDLEKLRELIGKKLQQLEGVAKKRESAQRNVAPVLDLIVQLKAAAASCERHGSLAKPPTDMRALTAFATHLEGSRQKLEQFLPLAASIAAVEAIATVPADVLAALGAFEAMLAGIPDPTQQDAARDYLTIGQERLEAYRRVSSRLKRAEADAKVTATAMNIYGEVCNAALEDVYKKVEKDFTAFYRFINADDEDTFEARLTPSMGKLGFDVDFYGRGHFPPGAYHSEGHQDGMGLCLYLALMRHLLGDGFSLAVLDDVLMSVDAGHRRKVCSLLKKEFPKTQFVLTTHDDVWLRHMKTEGLIAAGGSARFRKWSVDQGPTEWDDRDVWQEIEGFVAANDIRSGAALLRHYLEYFSAELCHRLRARVEFRGDAQFQLGDLLPPAIASYRSLLREGKSAAQSWAQSEVFEALDAREKEFAAAAQQSTVEQWQTNPAVHYNEWANFQKEDFAPVVASYKRMMSDLFCDKCNGPFYVSPERGERETVRCTCGALVINLKKKPQGKK